MSQQKDLDGKVVLITGASRGIGYATAVEAAKRGAHIIAVARTVGALEELDDAVKAVGSETTLVPLNITDYDAIDRLGAAIFERWKRLDGFIGNAGLLGVLSPLSHIDPDEFNKVMAVNVTANYRFIRSVDSLIRQADAGRVVLVSSSSAKSCRPYWGLYAASKAALDALAKSYAGEVENTPVRVNSFYPGAVRTAMRAKAMPGEDPDTLPMPDTIAPLIVDMISPDWQENGKIFDAETKSFR